MIEQSVVGSASLEDPETMRAVFQGCLQPAAGTSLDIRSCEISYVRHSPTRSVLQYSLQVFDDGSGQAVTQIVTGATYGPERTREQWDRAMESDPAVHRPVGPLAMPAIVFVPEFDLIVQTFPYDYRLPGLIRVVEGTPELVAILFADVDEGNWFVESWDAKVARYRPDMRAMVRVDLTAHKIEDDQRVRCRTYAKIYRINDQGQHAFRLLQALEEQAAAGGDAFSVAHPIEYIETWQTLLVREAPGDRLLQLVRRGDPAEATSAVRRAARAVAGFHRVSLPAGLLPEARKVKHEQLMDVTARLARRNPDKASAIERLVKAIRLALEREVQAPTHFDLKLGHILLACQQATILDFDKMAIGDPLLDVANLVATLDAEREGSSTRTARRSGFADAFVDEYFTHVPDDWRARFPAHYAQAALIEAGTTGRGQRGRPGQRDRSGWLAAAIEQAERAMNGELW